MLNQTLQNLKQEVHKYAIIAMVVTIAIGSCHYRVSREVRRNVLIGESFLHLSPRNVSNAPTMLGGTTLVPGQTYIPPESKVVLVSKQPNSIFSPNRTETISFKQWGFTHELGLEIEPFPVGVGLDFKWLYLSRLGSNIGFNLVRSPSGNNVTYTTPSLSLSYHLDRVPFLSSTEILLGYSPLGPLPAYLALRLTIGR